MIDVEISSSLIKRKTFEENRGGGGGVVEMHSLVQKRIVSDSLGSTEVIMEQTFLLEYVWSKLHS